MNDMKDACLRTLRVRRIHEIIEHCALTSRVWCLVLIGFTMPGGTYLRSRSTLEPMTNNVDGEMDFECPYEYTRYFFGAMSVSTCL